MNIMQVLVIEADQMVCKLLANAVIAAGHAVTQIASSQAALTYIQHHTVDLILIAAEMPVLDGFETTKAIRAFKKDDWLPILLFSPQRDDATFERCIKAGADALWAKPINYHQLQWQITALEHIFLLRQKYRAAQIGLVKLNDTLNFLSMYDQLTGLANRRNFDETLRREFKLAQRDNLPLSLLKCNVDFFKAYNAHYGQKAGDDCLAAIATTIISVTKRPTDLACRYGHDEFAVILPKTNLQGAQEIREKINQALAKRKIPHVKSPLAACVTLSIGVAITDRHFEYVHELIHAADANLVDIKQSARQAITPP